MRARWAITYFGQPRNCRAARVANQHKLPADADVFFHLWRPPVGMDPVLTSASRFAIEAPPRVTEDELVALYEPRAHVYQEQRAFDPQRHPHLAVALDNIPPVRVMSMLFSLQQCVALAARAEYTAVLALRTDVVLTKPWPDDAVPTGREVLLAQDQGTVEARSWQQGSPAHLDFLAAGTPESLSLYASCSARLDALGGHWVPEFLLGDNLANLGLSVRRVDVGKLEILR